MEFYGHLLPRLHVDVVQLQGQSFPAVFQLADCVEDFRLDGAQLVDAFVEFVFQLDQSVKLVRVFCRLRSVAVVVLRDMRQPVACLVAGLYE